jgi:DNA repair photolyase
MAFRGWETGVIRDDHGNDVEAKMPVIISASRSTDIPAFYSDWFINRWKAGYVKWVNPFNQKRDVISFKKTRLVVFWSKNPRPLMRHLPVLDDGGMNYYFQFTVNDYESEGLEPKVPSLSSRLDTFCDLATRIGKERVIWRFDPLILTEHIDAEVLLSKLEAIGSRLSGSTEKLVISFADIACYRKVERNLDKAHVRWRQFEEKDISRLGAEIAALASQWGIQVSTCAEAMDLGKYGISHNRCIDDELMIRAFRHDAALMDFLGWEPTLFGDSNRPNLKDKGQRKECGCIVSKDIGMYNTCPHLCTYCYANASQSLVEKNYQKHSRTSEALLEP